MNDQVFNATSLPLLMKEGLLMLKHVGKEVAVAAISFFICGCYWTEWLASALALLLGMFSLKQAHWCIRYTKTKTLGGLRIK